MNRQANTQTTIDEHYLAEWIAHGIARLEDLLAFEAWVKAGRPDRRI